MKKKFDITKVTVYGILIFVFLYACAGVGYALDLSYIDGEIDINLLANNLNLALSNTDGVLSSLKDTSTYCFKFTGFGVFGGGIYALCKYTDRKKFHRRGVEYGSARWGTYAEAKKLVEPEKSRNKKKVSKPLSIYDNDLNEELTIKTFTYKSIKKQITKQFGYEDKKLNQVISQVISKMSNYELTTLITSYPDILSKKEEDTTSPETINNVLLIGRKVIYKEITNTILEISVKSKRTKVSKFYMLKFMDRAEIEEVLKGLKITKDTSLKVLEFIHNQNLTNKPYFTKYNEYKIYKDTSNMVTVINTKNGVSCSISIDKNNKKDSISKLKKIFDIVDKLALKIFETAIKPKEVESHIINISQNVQLDLNTRYTRLNLNVIVFGASGSGKSRFFAKPNILEANCSYVVTDPKGELLRSCGKFLEDKGYEVRVLNVMAEGMKTSFNYNPFAYLTDSEGNFAPNNVMKMITALLQNTKAEGQSGGDQFWEDATTALLTALSFYLVETQEEKYQNFSSIMDLLKEAEVKDNQEDFQSDLDLRFAELEAKSKNSLAVKFYKDYKKSAGDTAKSILISCSVRLRAFNMPDVANLTYCDTIDIKSIGDKKTAVFLIIPSTDTTFNFLIAMFYAQLFDILYDRANFKYGGRLPIHVRCILDEFANIGKIPEFEKKLATMRSMEISANCIFQNVAQLKKMYEKSWQELIGNCDTRLLLGASDTETLEYFSKALGKETIDTRNNSQSKGKNFSNSTNDGAVGRELLTPDEIEVMDTNKCIVMVRNHHPFLDDKFKLEKHRNYSYLEDANSRNAYLITDVHTKVIDVEFPSYKELQNEIHTEPVDDEVSISMGQDENIKVKSEELIENKEPNVENVEFPIDISEFYEIDEELFLESFAENEEIKSIVLIEPLDSSKIHNATEKELNTIQDLKEVENEEDFFIMED